MHRILIIGGNGSGKTTMSSILAERTGLPLVHLDALYWTANWVPREREDFIRLLQAELEKPEWIMDGNMRRTLPMRLPYCDTVIYLDFPGIVCFFGTIRRIFQNYGKSRADMGGSCIERFDRRSWKFIRSTLSFNKKNRKYFYTEIGRFPDVTLIVLKNRKQVRRFLENIGQSEESGENKGRITPD
ncbi:MAG: topology modulation protein [Lachnospiraceae bacterium]|nr:topology modulation protein [Lachnospiraceae bacterium]